LTHPGGIVQFDLIEGDVLHSFQYQDTFISKIFPQPDGSSILLLAANQLEYVNLGKGGRPIPLLTNTPIQTVYWLEPDLAGVMSRDGTVRILKQRTGVYPSLWRYPEVWVMNLMLVGCSLILLVHRIQRSSLESHMQLPWQLWGPVSLLFISGMYQLFGKILPAVVFPELEITLSGFLSRLSLIGMIVDVIWLYGLWSVLRLRSGWYVFVLFILAAASLLWIAIFGGALLEYYLHPDATIAILSPDLQPVFQTLLFFSILILGITLISLLLSAKAKNAILGPAPRAFYLQNG